MRNNLLFILILLAIIATYVACYQLFTESVATLTTEMTKETYTIEVRNEEDLLNSNYK